MEPLLDSSNRPLPERAGKRQRLDQLEGPATFQQIVDRAGIRGLTEGSDGQQLQTPEVDDPRQARRQLAADLSTAAARESFMSSLSEALAEEELLHKCLLPITVTVQVNYSTGDSLVRMLLNVPAIQQQLATLLLQKLPEFSQTECDDGDTSNGSSIPSLILGQLRWLEVVADAAGLTATVLEVLPVCSPSIQQQLIGFLPEVVMPQDHQAVIEQLKGLLDHDVSFMAAVLDCIANMQLEIGEQQLQDQVLSALLDQLKAVEVEDLPGLVRYLMSSSTNSNAEQVLNSIRSVLHFVSPSDPRLQVPDRKQKGVLRPNGKTPEVLLVKELVAALQASDTAAAATLKLEAGLTDPKSHRCFDLLVLLALHAKGGASRKAVEGCLKKKLTEGHATAAWISTALQGHQVSFREVWPSLLALAESWSRAREAELSAAAVKLYVELFVGVDANLERQQVLQALHGHLGSGVAGEQDVALQALSCLAVSHQTLLGQYSSYLANVLDHLEGFSNSQLRQVFSMFAALTAVQPAAAAAGSSSSAAAAAAVSGGTRLQDELIITLNKALAQNTPAYKRIGVVGTLALLRQSGVDYEKLADGEGSAAGALRDSWIGRAESLFAQCMSHPGVLAFMMDHWSELLEQQGPHAEGAAAEAGVTAVLPKPMLEWLYDKLQDMLNSVFLADYCAPEAGASQASHGAVQQQAPPQPTIQLDDSNLKAQLWFNLDGSFSPVYLQVLPVVVSRDFSKRALLAWLPPCLRLIAAVSHQMSAGNLAGIDALLGCPIALPEMTTFTDGRWDSLPMPSKVAVLTSVMHAICWLREVVAIFAPGVSAEVLLATSGDRTTQDPMDSISDTQNKLLMRLSQLRELEALYRHLVTSCPAAAQQLPDMSCALLSATGAAAAAPAAAAAALEKRKKEDKSKKAGDGKPEAPAVTPDQAMTWLRCLRLPAAFALITCQPPHMLLTSLLPATHLAVDLHTKLKLLVSRARRPAGLMAAPAALPAAAAGLAGAAGIPGLGAGAAGGPPCLQGLTVQRVVQQLEPLLPALQQHLAAALSVISEPPGDDRDVLFDGLPGANIAAEAVLFQVGAVGSAVEVLPAAHSLAMACLQCFTLLLGCSKELSPPLMQQVLAALAPQAQATAGANQQHQLHALLGAAFKATSSLSCKDSGNSTLQLELASLSLLQVIAALGVSQGLPAKQCKDMAKQLSAIAEALLQDSWQQEEEAEEGSKGGFSWKGQSAAISQLLAVLISQADEPSVKLLELTSAALTEVPGKVAAKQQLDPAAGYCALCSATYATWYKVVFEQLVSHWEKLVSKGQHLIAAAGTNSSSRGGRGTQQQPVQLNGQGVPNWDDEQVDALLPQAQRCCQVFGQLVQLTKQHPARNGVLAAAVKLGGQFIDALLKALTLWRALYANGYDAEFASMVKDVQKGTKTLQTICNEGKARSNNPLLSRAPAVKRSLERFVFEMKAFFHAAGQPDTFWLGNLKHRDLAGNVVGSQMYPADEEGDDDDDDDGAASYEEEEEEPEGSAVE